MLNMMWFRSDLRVYDNPALFDAMAHGPTVAVYFVCRDQWASHGVGENKQGFVVAHLTALRRELNALNVPLIMLDAGSFSRVPALALALCAKLEGLTGNKVRHWFFNAEYEVNEQRLSETMSASLSKAGMTGHMSHDQCLIEPGSVRNGQNEAFKVFSAFKRSVLSNHVARIRPLVNRPQPQEPLAFRVEIEALSIPPVQNLLPALAERWPAGEEEAHDRLNRFVENAIRAYSEDRDHPALAGTSTLSPYLAVGALSVRQCWQAAVQANHGRVGEGQPGVAMWMNELLWREFYRHLMFFYPKLCKGQAFKPETEELRWNQAGPAFDAWKTGRTGFPIVDAAMRQLLQTGWMHNRLRMIVAMFLTKDLFVDWRLGEAHFMAHLIDGDLASNNGGWQWSASTGVDAVPYFRIFNPTRQSERFDADGDFIRHFVPELASVRGKAIHNPPSAIRAQVGYPEPIVNHAKAAEQTKQWFAALGKGNTEREQSPRLAQDDLFRRLA